jgi:hypothetical protein
LKEPNFVAVQNFGHPASMMESTWIPEGYSFGRNTTKENDSELKQLFVVISWMLEAQFLICF